MGVILNFKNWKGLNESTYSVIVDDLSKVENGMQILKWGRAGKAVEEVQKMLNVAVDGKYGPVTKAAVEKFQAENGLQVDGIIGQKTIAALKAKLGSAGESIPQPEVSTQDEVSVDQASGVKFPIYLSGSYKVPPDVPAKADARHAFDRRRSDKFGGRMLRGWEDSAQKSRWGHWVKLDQDVGINQKLNELIKMGIKPDVQDIKVDIKGNTVNWSATIIQSKDGKAWAGVSTRGSAGGGKQNALNQVQKLKSDNPNLRDWTVVHEIDQPYLNQFFLKYTV
jgi:peptidoglycan hydrolase-like protein with peptidoglycan-binding domain